MQPESDFSIHARRAEESSDDDVVEIDPFHEDDDVYPVDPIVRHLQQFQHLLPPTQPASIEEEVEADSENDESDPFANFDFADLDREVSKDFERMWENNWKRVEFEAGDAEREEREAEIEVANSEKRIQQLERDQQKERDEFARTIAQLREQIRITERRMNVDSEERLRLLSNERVELQKKRAKALEKKEARAKAMRKLQEHPHAQSLRYTRSCPVCLNGSPTRRVAMTECGHMLCVLCAEDLQKTPGPRVTRPSGSPMVSCPLCRKLTGYVKTFEDLETPKVRQEDARETRKRKLEAVTILDRPLESVAPRRSSVQTSTLPIERGNRPPQTPISQYLQQRQNRQYRAVTPRSPRANSPDFLIPFPLPPVVQHRNPTDS